jgi:hypothetical protein
VLQRAVQLTPAAATAVSELKQHTMQRTPALPILRLSLVTFNSSGLGLPCATSEPVLLEL